MPDGLAHCVVIHSQLEGDVFLADVVAVEFLLGVIGEGVEDAVDSVSDVLIGVD
jgi:Na+/serine symporter